MLRDLPCRASGLLEPVGEGDRGPSMLSAGIGVCFALFAVRDLPRRPSAPYPERWAAAMVRR